MSTKQRVILTGGLGFIGSHTAVELSKKGFETIIIDNLDNSDAKVLDAVRELCDQEVYFEETDLKDKSATEMIFEKYDNICGIIHFAAHKAVGESMTQPLKYFDNNFNSLINILSAQLKFDIPNLIFSSSCTVYGETEILPVTEETPFGYTFSPYGYTKQVGECMLDHFTHANKNCNVISLRYFNPIGAHPSAKIGELPSGKPENLMPFITQTVAGIRDELSVFGGDYDTRDGTAIRDYIYVVDLAEAHVISLQRLLDKINEHRHERFNIGSGNGYTVLEVIQSFERSTGLKVNYKIVDRRPGDTEAIYADTQRSRNVLNWQPKHDIDDMTRTAWEWEKKLRGIN